MSQDFVPFTVEKTSPARLIQVRLFDSGTRKYFEIDVPYSIATPKQELEEILVERFRHMISKIN